MEHLLVRMANIDFTPSHAGFQFFSLYLSLASLSSRLTCFCNSLLRVISPLVKTDVSLVIMLLTDLET